MSRAALMSERFSEAVLRLLWRELSLSWAADNKGVEDGIAFAPILSSRNVRKVQFVS
jgi:hypothetical protein